jgi:hypothetical protein
VLFATASQWVDRLVHHAEVVALRGDSYRLKNRDLGRVPNRPGRHQLKPGLVNSIAETGRFSVAVDTVEHVTDEEI